VRGSTDAGPRSLHDESSRTATEVGGTEEKEAIVLKALATRALLIAAPLALLVIETAPRTRV
jgi:hypothetical protein